MFRKKEACAVRSVGSVKVIVEKNYSFFENIMSCLTFENSKSTQITGSNSLSCQFLNSNDSTAVAKCFFFAKNKQKTLDTTLCTKLTMFDC